MLVQTGWRAAVLALGALWCLHVHPTWSCWPLSRAFWGFCRSDVLEAMPPFLGGGEMIEHVGLDVSTYAPPPSRFEPGTPPIAEAIGMGAAADYLGSLGLQAVRAYEEDIGRYLYERVRSCMGW